MDFDFSAYDPKGKTARMTLPIKGAMVPDPDWDGPKDECPVIEKSPTLIGKIAGDANRGYINALARKNTNKTRQNRRRAKSGQEVIEVVERDRKIDREIYPGVVLVGCEGIPDTEGKEAPNTREVLKQLCEKLPDWIFDQVRGFFANPVNFTDDSGNELPDPEALQEQLGN